MKINNEKEKKIMKAKINNKKNEFITKIEEFYNGLNALFYLILKDPLDNLWWESISITFQYSHMILFIVNRTVSIKFIIIIISSYQFGIKISLLMKYKIYLII